MSLAAEFKKSLKTVDSEEILDLLIFRPISFAFVKLIYSTAITPNQISIIAMIFGIFSGVFYAFGSYDFMLLGALSLFICNTLDCADGQLARLKNNGTRIGRVVDGFIDYITSISIFIGLGIAMTFITGNPLYAWSLTVAAGISKAVQNLYFDNFRNMYLQYAYGKASNIEDEIQEFTEEKERLASEKGKFIVKLLVNLYLGYTDFQKRSAHQCKLDVSPDEYKSRNKFIIRMWSWIGSTTHAVVLIVFTILNRIDIYLILTVTAGNLAFIILMLWQKNIIGKFSAKPAVNTN